VSRRCVERRLLSVEKARLCVEKRRLCVEKSRCVEAVQYSKSLLSFFLLIDLYGSTVSTDDSKDLLHLGIEGLRPFFLCRSVERGARRVETGAECIA
jgi:hypothetical protein